MKNLLGAIFTLILISSTSWGRSPSCFETNQLVRAAGSFHVTNPKVDEQIVKRAGKIYIDFLDPYQFILTQSEYDSLISKLNKHTDKYLALFYDDSCAIFEDIEKAIDKGDKRKKAATLAAIKLGPKKIDLKKKKKHFKDSEIKSYLTDYYRNSLFENKSNLAEFTNYLKTRKSIMENLKDDKNIWIVKSFYLALDPHSNYFTNSEWKRFNDATNATVTGFGMSYTSDYIGLKIESLVKDAPLDKSKKVEVGDHIVKMNGIEVNNEKLFSQFFEDPSGTEYRMVVRKKDGSIIEFNITSEKFADTDVKVSSKVVKSNGKNILVMKVPSFYYNQDSSKGTSEDIYEQYLDVKDQHIDLILMDLRNNPGGLLDQAQRVVGLFVGDKVVVYSKSKDGIPVPYKPATKTFSKLPSIETPLVILENKSSASASEIVAGALKVYGRALIIGDKKSYGKGTVQEIFPHALSEQLGVIKLTVSKFYLPNGDSTQLNGVSSDVVIPNLNEEYKGEGEHIYALPFDRIQSDIKSVDLGINVKKLIQLSKNRIKSAKSFKDKIKKSKMDQDVIMDEALSISTDYLKEKEVVNVGNISR